MKKKGKKSRRKKKLTHARACTVNIGSPKTNTVNARKRFKSRNSQKKNKTTTRTHTHSYTKKWNQEKQPLFPSKTISDGSNPISDADEKSRGAFFSLILFWTTYYKTSS